MLVVLACYYQTFTRYQIASLVPDIHPMPVATTPFFLYLWHVTYADREEMREQGVSGCQASAGSQEWSCDLWLSSSLLGQRQSQHIGEVHSGRQLLISTRSSW